VAGAFDQEGDASAVALGWEKGPVFGLWQGALGFGREGENSCVWEIV
jgi:hypothetical protein